MTTTWQESLRRARSGETLRGDAAYALADAPVSAWSEVASAAAERRDLVRPGKTLTFSPKVFLPVTNLCRNRCDYCTFRRSPGDAGEWTMTPDEVIATLDAGAEAGCTEALLCLGDTPETGFRAYRALLESWGHARTVDYLRHIGELALDRGLFAHTNAGIMSAEDLALLRPVNASMGLMLENVSERLCQKGMPHHKAPDKRPKKRLAMTRAAGELRIPFTSGLLIGIGETMRERVDTLLAIAELHERYGHLQEAIVQNFRAKPDIPMAAAAEPEDALMVFIVALARLILPADMSVQAPPNLSPEGVRGLIRAGLDDFGGISPVTPDFINPGHPWPHLARLADVCADEGYRLAPRLPVHDRYLDAEGWIDPRLVPGLERARRELPTRPGIGDLHADERVRRVSLPLSESHPV